MKLGRDVMRSSPSNVFLNHTSSILTNKVRTHTHTHTYIYIYIYIYIVLFGPVKPELAVIPSGQENHSGGENLNFIGGELNVIFFTEQYFFKKKTKTG